MKTKAVAEKELMRDREGKKRSRLIDAGMAPISFDKVQPRLVSVRNQLVIIDADAAELYGVSLRHLNEQVLRNVERFPRRFMFRLAPREFAVLKSQAVVPGLRGRRKPPMAFTEMGLYMVATVLRGCRAAGPVISMVETLALACDLKSLNATFFRMDRRMRNAGCTLYGYVMESLGLPTPNFIGKKNYAAYLELAKDFSEKFCQAFQKDSRTESDAD